MGKAEEEHVLPSTASSDSPEGNAEARCGFRRCFRPIRSFVGVKCVLVLLLSAAIFLSAVFWLPPFRRFADRRDLDLDSPFKGHDIVATFYLRKPVSLLKDNIWELEGAIYDEINIPSKVAILSLKPFEESNQTRVIFSVDPEAKNSRLSEASRSLIKELFEDLVTSQYVLHLNPSLFGDAEVFEVLKFPGGITIIPVQSVFLLQKVQILFNFTLNFSIYQIQEKFEDLKSQLKSGLRLASYENLYVSLSNVKGSTLAAPTIVQSSVVLAVGNPSTQRLRQLAQTITSPHSKNLGLNNTVFGKVKQVRLSSIPQQFFHGGDGSPSPAPAPQPQQKHHHHHHHHHHQHHHNAHLSPSIAPEPATMRGSHRTRKGAHSPEAGAPTPEKSSPSPKKSYIAKPPGCHVGYRSKGEERKRPHLAPAVAPSKPDVSPHRPAASPRKQAQPSRPVSNSVPVSSPLPSVVFAHVQPPSKSNSDNEHVDTKPSIAPTPWTSSAGSLCIAQLSISLFFAFLLHL